MTSTDVLIVGGGLSGLHTAFELQRRGFDYLLIEARDRLGGRVLSRYRQGLSDDAHHAGEPAFDLGPAWFWPGQARIEALVRELELGPYVFAQHAEGLDLLETGRQGIQKGHVGASMAGSFRLRGGIGQIIHALAGGLPDQAVLRASRAKRLEWRGDRIHTTVDSKAGSEEVISSRCISSRWVVLALPPRLAEATLDFQPELSVERRSELRSMATWMAGQGKMMALYEEPFWRRQGLSGDALSYIGPLGEIHDASPDSGGPYALFGFFGIPPEMRRAHEHELQQACVSQLERLFGPEAGQPSTVFLKDWAFDPLTATPDDRQGPAEHSLIGLQRVVEETWGRRILWSGSETASPGSRNNGYLEGALEASWRTIDFLTSQSQYGC